MALQLVDRVWMLAERLYIHTHSVEDFLTFLNAFGVVYPGLTYADFGQNKPLYKFMSEPNFEFAEFMKKIPTHRYLRILEAIAFDENIRSTTDDGFNYYGEKINRWYPEFIQLIELAGINVDLAAKKLIYNPAEIAPQADELFSDADVTMSCSGFVKNFALHNSRTSNSEGFRFNC